KGGFILMSIASPKGIAILRGTMINANQIVVQTLPQKSLIKTGFVKSVLKLSKPINCVGKIELPSNFESDITMPNPNGKTNKIRKLISIGPRKKAKFPYLKSVLVLLSCLISF